MASEQPEHASLPPSELSENSQRPGPPVRGLSLGSVSAPATSDNPAGVTGHFAPPCNLCETATPRRGRARPTSHSHHMTSRWRTLWRSHLQSDEGGDVRVTACPAFLRVLRRVSRSGDPASAEQESACAGPVGERPRLGIILQPRFPGELNQTSLSVRGGKPYM